MSNGMRFLLTGGSGFIGSELTSFLLRTGHDVTVLDIVEPKFDSSTHNLHYLSRDIRSLVGCSLGHFNVVVHLAAEIGVGESMHRLVKYVDTNALGTAALLEAMDKDLPEYVILPSSRAVYGEGYYSCAQCGWSGAMPQRSHDRLSRGHWPCTCPKCDTDANFLPMKEEQTVYPVSVYGASKYSQEDLLRIWCRTRGVTLGIARLFNVYGPGQSSENPYAGLVKRFAISARLGEVLPVYEDGLIVRDFVHIKDVVEAFSRMFVLRAGGIFNIGSGDPITIRELATSACQLAGTGATYAINGAFRLGDVRSAVADISKSTELLGWRPRVSLEDGLMEVLSGLRDEETMSTIDLEELMQRGLGGVAR